MKEKKRKGEKKEKKITIRECVPGENHPDSGPVRLTLIILSCIWLFTEQRVEVRLFYCDRAAEGKCY